MIDAIATIQDFVEFIDSMCDIDDERAQDVRTSLMEWKLEEEHKEECE